MPQPNQPALDFLLTRQLLPAKTFRPPVPSRDELLPILTAAARTPDHGKLEPWRFIVLERAALQRIANLAADHATALGYDAEKTAKGRAQFDAGHLAVVVVASPKPSEKIPPLEQTLSAGAVCLSLLNAATAAGWAANWLSGWPAHDPAFAAAAFGIAPHEFVAGIVHIGTTDITPADRPRPDITRLTTWVAA